MARHVRCTAAKVKVGWGGACALPPKFVIPVNAGMTKGEAYNARPITSFMISFVPP
ncbi:hypothetical protein SAQ01S_34740 [Sphingomonas aquatilis NBRC 16722]|nr:hypothetical protein SAQ01S_34740 [Sphingomonas aquatilis NBRC 16722]